MGIRMSGLSSGMDTEAIVGALMSAQSLKKTKIERSKTKLEWKQTKWADLNTKLCKLYNEQVSKMQLKGSYMTKKASVSDATKASVSAGTKAVNGSYTLEVKNIATAQYLTGKKIDATSTSAKLTDSDIAPDLLNKEITITNGDKTKKLTVTSDTTIADFTKVLNEAGLNANFDTTQQRFFISSKDSGLKNAFSITTAAVLDVEVAGRENLRNAVGYNNMSAANKKVVDEAMEQLQTSGVGTDSYDEALYNKALDAISKAVYDTKTASVNTSATTYMKAKLYSENYASYKTKAEESLKSQYFNEDDTLKDGKTRDDYEAAVAKKADEDTTSFVNTKISSDHDIKVRIEAAAKTGIEESVIGNFIPESKNKYYSSGVEGFAGTDSFSQDDVKKEIASAVYDYAAIADRTEEMPTSGLGGLGLANITVEADGTVKVNGGANDSTNASIPKGMALIAASDSKIILNGAELTSSSSMVSANGLDITLTGLTKADEPITFSVQNDVDSVYNSVKTFLKEYNEIMKEMNTLYNASTAKGYEPLTKEQKKEMSDDDIKLWEDKIKGSLFRNDTTLGGIISGMRSAMTSQAEYDGKKYTLASFGIMTSSNYMEGGLFHIYGDKEDSVYADRDDKLKKALAEDSDAVVSALSDIFSNLRQTMSQKMASSKTSSALTFYSDIKMKEDLKNYEEEIEDWEDRLATMEDAYYKKFTAMETALAKLQSQQNSLAGLFGN